MKRTYLFLLPILLLVIMIPAAADDQITYTSQPDSAFVFLNNVVYVQDVISIPGGADVTVNLPTQIFTDTLLLYENDQRVPGYRIQNTGAGPAVTWTSGPAESVLEVRLEYLMTGISWRPKYDMWLGDAEPNAVSFDFFAEIRNSALPLNGVDIQLVAGRVDTNEVVDELAAITTNQMIAGFENPNQLPAGGSVDIQHIYPIGTVDADLGDTLYTRILQEEFSARRLLVWNAQTDREVTVIYKVRNESDMPLVEGVVRSYQNGILLASDFIEETPSAGEGSITVGNLSSVRVERKQSQERVGDDITRFEVELSLTSFSEETVEIEVVDRFPPDGFEFRYSDEPQREGNNLLRWVVTLEPGQSTNIVFEFKVETG